MEKPKTRKNSTSSSTGPPIPLETEETSEDELTKPSKSLKTRKTVKSVMAQGPSHGHLPEMTSEKLLLENMNLKKEIEEQNDVIKDLRNAVKELTEMVKILKNSALFSKHFYELPPHSMDVQKSKIDTKEQSQTKKLSFANMLKEEEENYRKNKDLLRKRGVERLRAHSPDGKSSEKEKLDKQTIQIKEILDSKWLGNNFYYQVALKDDETKWLEPHQFKAEKLMSDFHGTNPNAASPTDYVTANAWKTTKKTEMKISEKIKTKKHLSAQEIEFIGFNLTNAPSTAMEFKRLHFKIMNKRALAKCTYNQKIGIIKKVIHSYGLSANAIRLSLIGASVLEIYVQSDSKDRFTSVMRSHDWELLKDFDFYDFKSFDGKARSEEESAKCLESLIQRLAFLSASTRLRNLQACILDGLKEDTKERILNRRDEIIESRAGERTAYVQKSQ